MKKMSIVGAIAGVAVLFIIVVLVLFSAVPPIYSCLSQFEVGSFEGTPSEEEALIILQDFLISEYDFTQRQVDQLEINGPQLQSQRKYGLMEDVILHASLEGLKSISFGLPARYSFPSNIKGLDGNEEAFILESNKIYVMRSHPEPC